MARGVIEEVEEVPAKEVLMSMNALGYAFILTALAAGIAWIVYTAKSVNNKTIGEGDSNESTGVTSQDNSQLATITTCFEALVVSVLFYFVSRHHFSHMHQ